MRTHGPLVAALIGLIALTFETGRAQVPAPSSQPARVTELIQRARTEGQVRVIVGVRAAFVPEGRLSLPEATAQRTAIARAQLDVLNRVTGLPALGVRRFELIPFFAAQVGRAALEQLAAMTEVTSIEEDRAERPLLAQSAALISAPAAWQAGYSGSGWTIALLDTGVDRSNAFLAGKVVSEACYSNAGGSGNGTSLCPGGAPSSTASGSGNICPSTFGGCEHGTHVAGIAAGRQFSGGPALNGIGRDASLISVQVFSGFDPLICGSPAPCVMSFVSDQIAGLERVYSLRNTLRIAAVNMSLGGALFNDQPACDANNAARKAAIDQLRSVGIATVAASGNNGLPAAMAAPACISSAIGVGAVDDGSSGTVADSVSPFSNGAPFLSLLAPGRWITSSIVNDFVEMEGTSMASPHVAGAWSVLKQRKPLASVTEILQSLIRTGVPVADPRVGGTTHSRINVAGAVSDLPVDYMAFDGPPRNGTVSQPFTINGWALNMSAPPGTGTGVDAVHVWAFPASGPAVFVGAAQLGSARTDVGAIFGAQFTNSGWQLLGRGLAAGVYTLSAFARNSFNLQFSQVAAVENITVLGSPSPQVWIDAPAENVVVPRSFLVGGWAIDLAAVSGPGIDLVTVEAFPNPGSGTPPISLGTAAYGHPRPDLGALFGPQFTNSGFNLIVATLRGGHYRLVVSARSSLSGAFTGVREVTVTISEPLMHIDTPANGSTGSQPFAVGGWAIDRAAATGSGVDTIHVWAYPDPGSGAAPIFLGEATRGFPRPDVAAAFGLQFAASGYNILVTGLPRGHSYRVVVFPHSSVSGTFSAQFVDVILP
jgi:subtilisin